MDAYSRKKCLSFYGIRTLGKSPSVSELREFERRRDGRAREQFVRRDSYFKTETHIKKKKRPKGFLLPRQDPSTGSLEFTVRDVKERRAC